MAILSYITVMMTVTLVCGGLITMLAIRAYRRTHIPALRGLAVGLGFVTFGGVVAGVAHQFTSMDLTLGIGIQSTFTAVGFAIIAYSLYADELGSRRLA